MQNKKLNKKDVKCKLNIDNNWLWQNLKSLKKTVRCGAIQIDDKGANKLTTTEMLAPRLS